MENAAIERIKEEVRASEWRESTESARRAAQIRILLDKLPVHKRTAQITSIRARLTRLLACVAALEQLDGDVRAARCSAALQQKDPSLGITCAQYAVHCDHCAINDAVALKNSAVPLLWLKRQGLDVCHLPTIRVVFHPRPGDRYKREVHAHRWNYLPNRELVGTFWPVIHLACIKGFDRVVLCLWKEFGATRQDATRDVAFLRNFAAFSATRMAYTEEHVAVLRVLRHVYGIDRNDLAGGNGFTFSSFPEEPTYSGTRTVVKLFGLGVKDLVAALKHICWMQYYPAERRLSNLKDVIKAFGARGPLDENIGKIRMIIDWTCFTPERRAEIISAVLGIH